MTAPSSLTARAQAAGIDLRGATIDELAKAGIDLARIPFREAIATGIDLGGTALDELGKAGIDLRGTSVDALLAAGVAIDKGSKGFPHAALKMGIDLTGPDIHRVVRDAVGAKGERLDMRKWHSDCGTVHCIAGWVVTLAGEAGKADVARLRGRIAWAAAAIYQASDPELTERPPMAATLSRAKALAALKALAEG